MVLFSSFLPFDALQIHYIVPIKHSVEQLGMALLQAFFLPPPLLCLFWRLIQQQAIVPAQGGTPDFKWQGRSNGGKYRNHPKSLGLQTKKSLDQTIPTPHTRELLRIFRLFWIPPKIPTKIMLPRKILTKIFLPKKSRYWKFHTPKNSLIIPVTWNPENPPGHKSMKSDSSEKMPWYISQAYYMLLYLCYRSNLISG